MNSLVKTLLANIQTSIRVLHTVHVSMSISVLASLHGSGVGLASSPGLPLPSPNIMREEKKKKKSKGEDLGRPGKTYHATDVTG